MAPIGVGFIGLSTSGWAPRAHLDYLKQTDKYTIVAICNSSKESSENAIKYHSLPASTKAYGSAEELAADPAVELVVVAVRTDKHGPAVLPALKKGKAAYVEWPLGRNLQEAKELANLARQNGSKTMIGLQGRRSPVVNRLKQLVEGGSIGRVLSSSVVIAAGSFGAKVSEAYSYLNDPEVGGNFGTIHFGHMIDYVLYVLGPLANYSGTVSTQRKQSQITDSTGKIIREENRGTPDHITLQGFFVDGGVLSVQLRGGAPFKDTPSLLWRIYGETGEIQVTADSFFLSIGPPNLEVKLHEHERDTVEEVRWSDLDHHTNLPVSGQNVAALYEAFADGRTGDYADFDEAVKRHELLHNLSESSRYGTRIVA